MTTIAWDGNTLAADRAAWSGNMKYRVRKVHRLVDKADGKPILAAVCGNGSWAMAWLDWKFGKGQQPGAYHDSKMERPSIIALVVDSRRRVWEYTCEGHRIQRLGRLSALGAGQEMAMGAMAAGASAKHAIRIVIKHSDVAGIGVDAVTF